MNIESIPSALSGAKYVKSAATLPGSVSKDTAVQTGASGDILTLGSDEETIYSTYTNNGSFHVTGTDISEGKEMTDDEKWEAINAKYSDEPMTLKNYCQMVNDLEASGLITFEERCAAHGNAMSIIENKTIEYDLQDGELWNDEIPASFYLMNFDELLSDVSDESKDYNGYDAHNDQRAFLKSFYTKMADHFPQETME